MDINYNIKNHKKIAKKIKNTKSQKLLVRGNSKKKTKESQDKINQTEIINNDLYSRKSKKDLSTIKKIKVIKKIKIKKKKKEFNNQTNKISIYSNIKSSKLDLMHTIKKEKVKIIDNIDIHKDIKNHEIYTDYELNSFSYENALLYDKRKYFQYYISLIRTKQPLIFAFVPIKDYNSIIIKISLFLLLFTITYVVDALFFTETAIHKIYEDKGFYNISYFLPKIFFSFIISFSLFNLIKYFALYERNLVQIKKNAKNQNKVKKIKRCIIIKYICYFAVGLAFLIFFWYYLSSFCAVFKNSQVYLIKNTLISLSFSLIYPFLINFITCAFRIISLNDEKDNKIILYKISKVLQLIL